MTRAVETMIQAVSPELSASSWPKAREKGLKEKMAVSVKIFGFMSVPLPPDGVNDGCRCHLKAC
jgi:hypothetical protein